MIAAIIYLFFAIVTAWFGRYRTIGFWGFFVIALIFTPFGAALLLLATSNAEAVYKKTQNKA